MAKKIKMKQVLPKKLHTGFMELNKAGDVVGIDQLLTTHKIDINATFSRKKGSGWDKHLLHEILEGANVVDKIAYFSGKNADMNVEYMHSNILFRVIPQVHTVAVFAALLQYGVSPNLGDENGTTYLTMMTRQYTDSLIWSSPDITIDDALKSDDLEFYEVRYTFLELMMKNGGDPSIKNNDNTSALDWLAHRKANDESPERCAKLEKLFGSDHQVKE